MTDIKDLIQEELDLHNDYQRRLEEIRERKRLLEEGVTVEVKDFLSTSGLVIIKLSMFRDDIVNLTRDIPGRHFVDTTKENRFKEEYLDDFLNKISFLPSITLIYPEEVKKKIEEFRKTPDYSFDLDVRKANVIITPSVKRRFDRINFKEISTFTTLSTEGKYKFAISELYKIPNVIEQCLTRNFPPRTHFLSEAVKTILTGQVLRRKELEEISLLEDAPEIKSPFTGIDPKTNEPYTFTPDQRVAIKFDEAAGGRSIIAYDVGKGKTAIAIGLAERSNQRVLFICKANLKTNIKREIKKFTGKEATVFSGVRPDNLAIDYLFTKKTQYNIIGMEVIGREKEDDENSKGEKHSIMPWVEVINLSRFDRIFYDEAHLLKNIESKRSRAARDITSERIDFYTGTPVVNRPKELYPMLNILDREAFNQEASFINNFSDGKNGVRNLPALQDILKMYMIRRANTGLEGRDIPFDIELSNEGRMLYNKALEGLYISIRKGRQSNITSILTEFLRLKQVVAEDSCDSTVELIEDLLDQTEKKVLVYSQFKDCHAIIAEKLGSKCSIINGDIRSDEERYRIIDEFQDPSSNLKVLISNIEEGLTLTEAHSVIFNDLPWTPKTIIQFKGRAFGRTNDYHGGNTYFVAAANTVVQYIQELLLQKLNTIEAIVDDIHKEQVMSGSIINDLLTKLGV